MVRGHPQLPLGLREGDVVAGKYRIASVIGAGAMGTVVAARHVLLEEKVAIKFLRPDALGHPEAVPRFLREARASVRIKSEHVVRVHDVDVFGDSKAPYIVMEYLDGCDLAERLQRHGPLPMAQAVDILLQACEAIGEAHRLGIIHRDLKPANLFHAERADRPDFIKVVDFGISKLCELTATVPSNSTETDTDRLITADRVMMGSPVYMSPEQMESARDVDERTDIWALGVTLYELLTGRLPFSGRSLVHVYFSIASDKPLRMDHGSTDWPPELEGAIVKCLERNREKRFRTVRDLAQVIAPFAPRSSSSYRHRMAASIPDTLVIAESGLRVDSAPPAPQTLSSASRVVAPFPEAMTPHVEVPPPASSVGPSRRGTWAAGAAVAIVCVGGFLALRPRREDPRSPTTQARATTAPAASEPTAAIAPQPFPRSTLGNDRPAAGRAIATAVSASPSRIEADVPATPAAAAIPARTSGTSPSLVASEDAHVRALSPLADAIAPAPASVASVLLAPTGPSTPPPRVSSAASGSVLDRMLERQE